MSFDWIVYGFVALAVVFVIVRIIISVRNGSFKSSRPDERVNNTHFSDHSTGGGGDGN